MKVIGWSVGVMGWCQEISKHWVRRIVVSETRKIATKVRVFFITFFEL